MPDFSRTKATATNPLAWHEKLALAVAIPEITIQADKYFFYSESDAALGAVGGFNVSPSLLCLVYLYFAWFLNPTARAATTKVVFGIPNLLYMTAVAFSVFAADAKTLALCDLFLLLQAYALFFYFANRIRSRDNLVFCLYVIGATIIFQGVVCLGLRAMGGAALGREFLVGPVSFIVQADGRVGGTLSSPTLCGSLIALLWLPILALNLSTKSVYKRRFTDVALVLGAITLLLTQTRGAILSTALGSVILGGGLLLRGQLPNRALVLAAIGALASLMPLWMILQSRVVGDDGGSAESRKHLSLIAFECIQKNPIFGYGAGNCHLACEDVASTSTYRSEWYYTVHCKYLLVWIENGVAGFVSFVFVMLNGLRHSLIAWFSRKSLLAPIGLALFAAIAGHMFHMIVDIFNSRPQVHMLWIILGLAASVHQQSLIVPNRLLQRPLAQRRRNRSALERQHVA